MGDDLDRYVRYRNCAQAIRMAADEHVNPRVRRSMLAIAKQIDEMADHLETELRKVKASD